MQYLAQRLEPVGIELKEARVIADDPNAIVGAVNDLRARYGHLFTSGGIGPTHDDITAECIAAAMQVSIDVHEEARAILAAHYAKSGLRLTPARLRMARIPHGALLIENPVSSAPGFSIENVHVMAGVPKIFASMVDGVVPRLSGGTPLTTLTRRIERREAEIAGILGELAAEYPELSIGSYPFRDERGFGTHIVIRGIEARAVLGADARLAKLFEL